MNKNTLTCYEVADLFSVRATSVANLARLGKIKSIRAQNGTYLLDEDSVESWFNSDRSSKLRATRINQAAIEKETDLTADQKAMTAAEVILDDQTRKNKMNNKKVKVRMGIGNSVFSFIKNWEKRFPCFTLDEIHREYNKNSNTLTTRSQMSSIIAGLVGSNLLSRVRKGCYKLLENIEVAQTPNNTITSTNNNIEVYTNSTGKIDKENILVYIKEVFTWDISDQAKFEIISILHQKGNE